ncbi:MAG: hypothetical protein HXX10_07685 [Rhodoplanes sp.]|uniref:hypothetical protein n=1 Tax=Rhodoplanes sp. TaxID=1968906 RepID=UPI0017D150FB|nr:hypothetical protein [Rhodoplanes sp.]NVO13902.1 hypothetical protein [Rhodoplanes sp.]
MRLSDIKVDSAAIERGDWVDNIPELSDLRLKVRGDNNSDYRALSGRLQRALPAGQRSDGLAPDVADKITVELLHKTVLLDWSGLVDAAGVAVPYTPELALSLLSDPDFRNFRYGVAWAAAVVASRRKAEQDAAVKN